jgi:dihydroorotate dehydrogenase
VINRYGFNSDGSIAVLARLRDRIHTYITQNALLFPPTTFPEAKISADPDPDPIEAILQNRTDAEVIDALDVPRSLHQGKILSINLGKNKLSAAESVEDFVQGVKTLGPYADVLVVNVSSPNTPGLRSLQRREIIEDLLKQVVKARNGLSVEKKPVVVLKIAPDLSRQEVGDIGEAAKASKIDGIVVSNTTISRPASAGKDPALAEQGGLSGPPVKPLSLRTLKTLYALTSGEIPLIGCGGISTGEDALDYAKAGASFVQLYTALGYQGVGLPRILKDEIAEYLKAEKKTWKDVVGSGIDLASIKALGRESNPAAVLSLEEEATDNFDALRSEIENALAGRLPSPKPLPLTREEKLAKFLPDWSDHLSPIVMGQATTPLANVSSPTSAESGVLPDGSPQVIIMDDVPQYTPAKPISKAEFEAKVEEAKQYADHLKDDLSARADELKEGAQIVGAAFNEAGKELKGDFRSIRDISKDAAEQAGHAFGEVGREIKEELHVVEDVAKDGARLAGQTFRAFGKDVQAEAKDAAREGKRMAEEAKKETDYVLHEVGKDLQHDRELTKEWARKASKVGKDAWEQSREVAEQFGRDLKRESRDAANVGKEAVQQSADTFRQFGRDVQAESHDAAVKGEQLLRDGSRELERDSQLASEALREGGRQNVRAFREAGHDLKQESATFGDIARDALRQTGQTFKELGREIKHDPLVRKAEEKFPTTDRAPTSGVMEPNTTGGVRADGYREDGGLRRLFSTFGERRNVTENSKRLV